MMSSTDMSSTIRLARPEDLEAAAEVFTRTFDASVWARMGVNSAQAYFEAWLEDGREFMVVADHPTLGVVGGLLGTMRIDDHRGPVLRAGAPGFARALVRDAAATPVAAVQLGRRMAVGAAAAVRRRFVEAPAVEVETFEPQWPAVQGQAYVAAYFVAPEARGQRLATRMCEWALQHFAEQGFQWCDVATYTDNIASQTTATRAGFRLVRREGTHLSYRKFIGAGEPGELSVELCKTPLDHETLPEIWADLLAKTPEVSGFHAWAWRRAQLLTSAAPVVAIVRLRGEPIAVFPFALDDDRVLRWLSVRHSNYSGPLFDPEHLSSVVAGFREIMTQLEPRTVDLEGLRERSPFYKAVRTLVLGTLGAPRESNPIGAPEIDLEGGWDVVWKRRKSKHRNNWRRAQRKLEKIGKVEYVELTDGEEIVATFDEAVELYETRWGDLNVDRAFGREHEAFQRAAAIAMARDGHVVMSVLRLEGEMIAFSYALRSGNVSNSYTLAHDDRYAPYSPGQLLLIHVLRAAAERGDPMFDFSVGDETYKDVWGTDRQEVLRLVWGEGARWLTATDTLKARLRAEPKLRRLKQEGVRALLPERPTGAEIDWFVQKVESCESDASLRELDLTGVRKLVPPALFTTAIDRIFRGDVACLLVRDEQPLAIVWKAAAHRRDGLARGYAGEHAIYFDMHPLDDNNEPIAAAVGALGSCVLVDRERRADIVHTFRAPQVLTPART